jgi:hypothetical protein
MKIKIDLHVHTRHSACALLKPEEIERIAVRRGLNAVAVTDHNRIDGALEVLRLAKTIKVIVAEEIKTSQGEIIGYFLKEQIQPGLAPLETVRQIRKQGGLVSIPHPFDRLRSSRLSLQALQSIIHELDMIEVFNSRDIRTKMDAGIIQKALNKGAVPVVSSDAHLKAEVGRSYMVMDDFKTPEEFLRNIKNAQHITRKSPFWVHIVTKLVRPYRIKKVLS